MYKDKNGNWHLGEGDWERAVNSPSASPGPRRSWSRPQLSGRKVLVAGAVLLLIVLVIAARLLPHHPQTSNPSPPASPSLCTNQGADSPSLALADAALTLTTAPLSTASLCYYAPQRAGFQILANTLASTATSVVYQGKITIGPHHLVTLPNQPTPVTIESISFTGNVEGCITTKTQPKTCQPIPLTYNVAKQTALVIHQDAGWYLLLSNPSWPTVNNRTSR